MVLVSLLLSGSSYHCRGSDHFLQLQRPLVAIFALPDTSRRFQRRIYSLLMTVFARKSRTLYIIEREFSGLALVKFARVLHSHGDTNANIYGLGQSLSILMPLRTALLHLLRCAANWLFIIIR